MRATKKIVLFAVLTAAAGWPAGGDPPGYTGPSQFAYHLRVVRVSAESSPTGAGLGCGTACGKPIVLPSEEA